MRLTVLGSSGGYPAPGSACSGYLLEDADTRLWIDAGSGTFARLLEHCTPDRLSAVLISHLHADHWTDLIVGLHTLRFAFERDEPLPVYGPEGWTETMGVVAEWAREEEPAFVAHELRDRETIEAGSLSIEAIEVEHIDDIDTFGFRISNEGCDACLLCRLWPERRAGCGGQGRRSVRLRGGLAGRGGDAHAPERPPGR